MKITILDGYTTNPGDLSWEHLKKLGELNVNDSCPPEKLIEKIGDSNAIFTSKCKITRAVMQQCKNLKFIGLLATGYDNVDLACAKELGIAVCNVPAYSTYSVAQHTIAFLLEICNQVGLHSHAVSQGEWANSVNFCFWKSPIMQLKDKSIGIIGYGAIGRQVGEIAKALGMKVNPYTGHGKEYPDLESAMKSDVVSFHCPANQQTIGMVNREFIAKMKDGAILLNCARGALIDETALAEALKSGKIYAAGVDVLSNEPPLADNPLVGLKNCFITPHIAWLAKEARQVICQVCYDNLKSYLEGGNLNRVI